MKIDITSLCFGFKIKKEKDTGTPAWATSIGQAPKNVCFIDTSRSGLDEIIYGMMYKSHSDFENLKDRDIPGIDKREEPRSDRERMMFSVFEDVYVNNQKVDGIYTLTYERENTESHRNRLHICYAKYLTYKGHSNKETLNDIAKVLKCGDDACWFVSDISIKNQSELHFTAIVVNAEESVSYADSKTRKKEWEILLKQRINTTDPKVNTHEQIIYFGAPGTGKSHKIEARPDINEEDRIRTTFHPDTDYSSFVGCYKPMQDKDDPKKILYKFEGQCFTKAYIEAWKRFIDPKKGQNCNFTLVIEEINRGNCAQIFGDIFQLLDRNEQGFSQYGIHPDEDLAAYLKDEFIGIKDIFPVDYVNIADGAEMKLPPNLSIIATMNTSDQSLFPIDSAFKRRWDWEYIPIQYKPEDSDGNTIVNKIDIDGAIYNWGDFISAVNGRIFNLTHSEDKELGYFFVKPNVDNKITTKRFVSKVIFYLWSDIYKDYTGHNDSIFKIDDEKYSFNSFFEGDNIQVDLVKSFIEGLGIKAEISDEIEGEDTSRPCNKSRQRKIQDIIDAINAQGPSIIESDQRFKSYKPGGGVDFVGKVEITKTDTMKPATFKKYRAQQYDLNGGYYIAVYNFSDETLNKIRVLLGIDKA